MIAVRSKRAGEEKNNGHAKNDVDSFRSFSYARDWVKTGFVTPEPVAVACHISNDAKLCQRTEFRHLNTCSWTVVTFQTFQSPYPAFSTDVPDISIPLFCAL